MKLKMLNITDQEIEESAKRACEDTEKVVMYLQNNGDEKHRWKLENFQKLLEQDQDD